MVTPCGADSDDQQAARRNSDPQRTQYTEIAPNEICSRGTSAPFNPAGTYISTFAANPKPARALLDFNVDMSLLSNGGGSDGYLTSSSNIHLPYVDLSGMAGQYLGLSSHFPNTQEDMFAYPDPRGDGSTSSHEGNGTSSSPNSPSNVFSTQSSPGYLQHELPKPVDSTRPHSVHGQYPHAVPFPAPYHPQAGYEENPYAFPFPGAQSIQNVSALYRPLEHWGVLPTPRLPSISQTSRCGVSQHTQSELSLFGALGRYPTLEELRRYPQIFWGMRTAAKKQTLACHFCRDRKIGCTRPDPDDPDQTCNQCARRNRRCEYPTTSRRGQHARRRTSKKYNVPTFITPSLTF